ncbi:MAG TPA: MXAN_6230/SCO0854 family RING domain-containing protein, partial [Kofleriaceae bacterium]|nr:MXAN_6230/SCO0854 family RING domain-containing protein [Kofleriaceae bacterium]
MDRIRTLLLARTHVVVMDPDLVAQAATRPVRDVDVEKLEDELAQLGYVLSLDLAMTLRRLPYQAMQELRGWLHDTLAKQLGAHRPHVPLFRAFPAGTPADTQTLFRKRILSWLYTRAEQPCPWCGETKTVGALDPCGHLVCRSCWDGASYAGCPICHRRVALSEPFVQPAPDVEKVTGHSGLLTVVHLGLDPLGMARERFGRLLLRQTPLSPDDRDEVEAVIDTIGPRAVTWLPARIPIKETMAIAVARLWLISPDRSGMVTQTAEHLRTATDILRVACVLMGGNASLVVPMRFSSMPRGLRRAVLEALDKLPLESAVEDMMRHCRLWKRVGERLHPFEHAKALPNAALAFAVARRTRLSEASFGASLRDHAVRLPFVYVEDDVIKPIAWAGPIEDALRAGNPRSALSRLTHRPGDLLRRADHLVRTAQTRQLDALQTVLKAVDLAAMKGPPGTLLTLASHVSRRARPWPRRVFFPKGEVLHAFAKPDTRTTLRGDAIAVMVGSIRRQLLARAEAHRQFPRAVIDRALVDLLVPINERSSSRAKVAWPRGSELAVPQGQTLRLFLHWEEPLDRRVDLDLSVAFFDASWRHVATCDFTNLDVGEGAAIHSGDLTSAPGPLGATELVDIHHERLAMLGARHAVMVVFSYNSVPFDRLPHAFAGIMLAPTEGQH